jgi:two-component system response regulator TctD
MRLLIVEDNRELADAIRGGFEKRHINCDLAHDAGDAAIMIETARYALVILDLGLPDADGMDMLRQLRLSTRPEPILVLTARGAVESRVDALRAGADDYMLKPFHFDELHARVLAILRRDAGYRTNVLKAGALELDVETRRVSISGIPAEISMREVELLELLLRRIDRVVPKQMLEDQLFGTGDALGSNAIEVYIHRIRHHLKTAGLPLTVQTVRGVGYMLLHA